MGPGHVQSQRHRLYTPKHRQYRDGCHNVYNDIPTKPYETKAPSTDVTTPSDMIGGSFRSHFRALGAMELDAANRTPWN